MRLEWFKNAKGRFSVVDNRTGATIHNGDPSDDFFVIKLKDQFAPAALRAYAAAAAEADPELAADVEQLARMAEAHPQRKQPD